MIRQWVGLRVWVRAAWYSSGGDRIADLAAFKGAALLHQKGRTTHTHAQAYARAHTHTKGTNNRQFMNL